MFKSYIIVKKNKNTLYHLKQEISGFHIKPKSKLIDNGIQIGSLVLVDPDLIEAVLRKKITKKLDAYLEYLMNVVDEENDESDDMSLIINDLKRYRSIILNRYSKFLDAYYIKMMLSKVNFIEEELKRKIKIEQKYYNVSKYR